MSSSDNEKPKVIFVTGFSGAGRSTALKILEDIGFEVFDNIPLNIVGSLIHAEGDARHVAIGIDTRTRYFTAEKLTEEIAALNEEGLYDARLVFISADETALQKRFSETRRRHPMASDRSVIDGIRLEAEILMPLLGEADYLVETTDYSVHDLRDDLQHKFAGSHINNMLVTIKSFGFKKGLPRDVDTVFDVRFLRNPHWDKALRPLTGQYDKVGAYILDDEDFEAFWQHTTNMIDLLLPRYKKEGKSYFTIGFGCMGGKHRSVFCAERLATYLQDKPYVINTQHRDMPDV